MNCPSPLTHSMYADGALAPDEAAALERHAATCESCRARIMALRDETVLLRTALQRSAESVPVPVFSPPLESRATAWLTLGVAAVGVLANVFWSTVGAAVPSGLRWLNPFAAGELFERALHIVTFIFYEGSAMWTSALNLIGGALLFALLGWGTLALARRRGAGALLASLFVIVLALPLTGHAFEVRNGALVTVAAGETIDDTLLAAGETIAIDGDVNGDLLAFGRRITVRGNVTGDLITGGETISVEGSVGGNIIGGGRGVSLLRARVGRNLYGFGRDVAIDAATEVVGNAIAFGETVDIAGRVDTDVKGFGGNVTIGGMVQGDVEGFAGQITLLPSARIGGDLTAHLDSEEKLRVASGAVVGGRTDVQLVEPELRRNRYLTIGYYVGQIVRLGTAFLTGLLLFFVFPVLRTVALPNAMAVLRSGGIGLAAAVTLPVAALLACITIVGLPLGLLTFLLGAVGLYFSKAVVAGVIGRALFRAPNGPPHYAATLLAGLAVVIVAINLPFVGGLAHLVITLVGFGMIVSLLLSIFDQRSAA